VTWKIVVRGWLGVVAVSSLLACKAAPGSASAAARDRVGVTLGGPWSAAPGKEPQATNAFGYAVARGVAQPILARHGFEYQGFVSFNNGPPVVQAVVAGSVAVGTLGDTPAVSGKAGGVDTRAILIDKPVGDAWFLARPGGARSVAELAGKKVGLQFGSNFDKYGRGVLQAAGVLAGVELVNVSIADGLAALTRGDVDGYALPATSAAIWVKKQGFTVLNRASRDNPELQGTMVTIVTSAFAQAHPEIRAAWWEATRAGVEEIQRDPSAYLRFLSDATGVPLDVVADTTPLAFAEQPIDPQGKASVQATLDFLLGFGTAKAPFVVNEWVIDPS
jgi:sulfonate transport system substrate-binding protein